MLGMLPFTRGGPAWLPLAAVDLQRLHAIARDGARAVAAVAPERLDLVVGAERPVAMPPRAVQAGVVVGGRGALVEHGAAPLHARGRIVGGDEVRPEVVDAQTLVPRRAHDRMRREQRVVDEAVLVLEPGEARHLAGGRAELVEGAAVHPGCARVAAA